MNSTLAVIFVVLQVWFDLRVAAWIAAHGGW